MAKVIKYRPVIVCTEYRGVFFGYAADTAGDTVKLTAAKMAIRFGTTRGVLELANTGPTPSSKISMSADILLHKVTSVLEVTPAAEKAWKNA